MLDKIVTDNTQVFINAEKKIAELEKFQTEFTPLAAYIARECNTVDGDLLFRFKDWLAKRDLEQQAKGLNEYVTQVMALYYIPHLNENEPYEACLIGANAKALKLRKQAKQLKGGDL